MDVGIGREVFLATEMHAWVGLGFWWVWVRVVRVQKKNLGVTRAIHYLQGQCLHTGTYE
jgi:hypothetical protein